MTKERKETKKQEKMEESSHLNPKTLSKPCHKSNDLQLATIDAYIPPVPKQNKTSNKCFVYTLLVIVLQSIALLVFALVVLQIRTPSIRLSTVTIKKLHYHSFPQLVALNMTVAAKIRLHNMNFGPFNFGTGNATLLFENTTIGTSPVHGWGIGSREKREINVTIKVIKDDKHKHHNYVNFSKDIDSGLVKLRGFGKLRGEIRISRILNRRRTAVMNCTMDLNLRRQTVQDLICY